MADALIDTPVAAVLIKHGDASMKSGPAHVSISSSHFLMRRSLRFCRLKTSLS
jgi:hypothetical protein